jgi:hypothetical protein
MASSAKASNDAFAIYEIVSFDDDVKGAPAASSSRLVV